MENGGDRIWFISLFIHGSLLIRFGFIFLFHRLENDGEKGEEMTNAWGS